MLANKLKRQSYSSALLTGYRSCLVFVLRDDSTRRDCRMHDFNKNRSITPGQYWCAFGKVGSPDETYLAIEFVKPDTKHGPCSNVLVLADGAGGRFIP